MRRVAVHVAVTQISLLFAGNGRFECREQGEDAIEVSDVEQLPDVTGDSAKAQVSP